MNKVSVVIATYNGEKFIEEQINSLLNQSYVPNEILIFDDGSTDNTINVIKKCINKKRINSICKLVKNKENKGYAKNFLEGALEAKNEIIFFCDQDDIWEKDKIKDMVLIMDENKSINLLCSNLEPFYYEKNTRKWNRKVLREMKNTEEVQIKDMNFINFHLKRSGCTMCMRKKFLVDIQEYWVENWAHDDFVWKMAVSTASCAIYQKTTVKRRMHANNATVIRKRTREKREKQLVETLAQYDSLKKFYKDNKLEKAVMEVLNKNMISIEKRLNVIRERKVITWIELLLKYRNCYPRIKGLFFDLYIAFFKEYEGV